MNYLEAEMTTYRVKREEVSYLDVEANSLEEAIALAQEASWQDWEVYLGEETAEVLR